MNKALLLTAIAVGALLGPSGAGSAERSDAQTAGGLTVYLGVLPAAMVQGHDTGSASALHGGTPTGSHAYHVVAAVFDAATGARIEDASVSARVTPRGLRGETRPLEPMTIAGTVTYGAYFTMAGTDPYRIEIAILPVGAARPVELEFRYWHGAR